MADRREKIRPLKKQKLDADIEDTYLVRMKEGESDTHVSFTDELWAVVEVEGMEEPSYMLLARYSTNIPKERLQ